MSGTTVARVRELERTHSALHVDYEQFVRAAADSGMTAIEAERFWDEVGRHLAASAAEAGTGLRHSELGYSSEPVVTRLVQTLLYFGGFLIVGSFAWWAASYKDWAFGELIALALGFLVAAMATAAVARGRRLNDLVAVSSTVGAFLIPLITYACLAQAGYGFGYGDYGAFYEWVDGGWAWLELAAIVGTAALWVIFRESLLMLPLFLFLWFAAMDVTARAAGLGFDEFDNGDVATIGRTVLLFGIAAVLIGTVLDGRGRRRHALWPHVFGAIGIVSGLGFLVVSSSNWQDDLGTWLVLAGIAFLVLGTLLARAWYLVAGGWTIWDGIALLMPTAFWLSISGAVVIAAGVALSLWPGSLRNWLATRTLAVPRRE